MPLPEDDGEYETCATGADAVADDAVTDDAGLTETVDVAVGVAVGGVMRAESAVWIRPHFGHTKLVTVD